MAAEAMTFLCDLPKVKSQSTKQRTTKLRLQNCLIWSGHCLNAKGYALECDYIREELLYVSDEVTWAMMQHGPGVFAIGLL